MPDRTTSKRPYLRAEQRRSALLDTASAIVDRDGLANLTMVGVADEAGISRQLVYRHFVDLDGLLVALLRSRFATMEESFERDAITAATDAAGFVEARVRAAMTMPAADHRLIRSVFGDLGEVRPDLAPTISAIRQTLIDRYATLIANRHHDESVERARIWAAINAIFGLWELYDDHLIDLDDAVKVFIEMVSPAAW